jgi:predicted MFS family arabinose efflux permease
VDGVSKAGPLPITTGNPVLGCIDLGTCGTNSTSDVLSGTYANLKVTAALPRIIPSLNLQKSGSDATLSWDIAAGGWALESSASLSSPSWTVVPGVVNITSLQVVRSPFANDPFNKNYGGVALLLQWPLVMCFAYFLVQTMATVGLQTFAPGTLNAAFGVAMPLALSTVTAYVLGGAAGILAGGFLAARTARHDRVAIAGLASAAVLTLVVAAGPPGTMFVPLLAVIGFAVGATGPSRDMIVRNATPQGASGRVYGFVYSGLDIGGTLGPVLFGVMLDHALSQQVFVAIAVLYVVAIATVAEARRRTRTAHAA